MQCGRCGTDNVLGASFCRQCGARLELTDAQAQAQAVAAVRQDNWQKAFTAMSRTLYFFFLVFIGAFLFRSCATQDVAADYSAAAPLPAPAPVNLAPSVLDQPELAIPTLAASDAIAPDQTSVDAITTQMVQTASDRLRCSVMLKSTGIIRGWLLSRTADEIRVITSWDPYTVRTIKTADIHFPRSKLP